MSRVLCITMAAAALATVPAFAESKEREVGVEASIAFPSNGGVRNFRVDDDRGVWIEDSRRNWYYARFIGNCRDIRWADAIGIDTRGSLRFDRNSRIVTESDVCAIDTLVTADKPLPIKEQRRYAKEAKSLLGNDELN